jgi:Predicted integral membrane protein
MNDMLKFVSTTVINRPVEDVFAVLSNLENNLMWDSVALEVKKTSEGPIGVGTTWRIVQKALGKRIEIEAEFTEYESNRKTTLNITSGPFPGAVRRTYEPAKGGTQVGHVFEIKPGSFFKLAEPLFMSMMKRGVENDLATLKDLMEAHAL